MSDSAFATTIIDRPMPARDHCLAPNRVDAPVAGARYGRLFPELDPLLADVERLHALGRAGGACDGSPLAAEGADDAVTTAAGWPFFGQFVAHDITADRSPLSEHADLSGVRNFRTPRLNLEAVYGGGQVGSPYLFDRDDPAMMLIGGDGCGDVPRNAQGIALLGDPRNDVHLFTSQMHVAFLHMHNRLVARLRADGESEADLFTEARRAAMWHYQWVVLHDFLPRLIGGGLATTLRADGARLFTFPAGEAYIPLEFADAAYRYGHGQIRHGYRVNADFGPLPLLPDLMGFGPVTPERAVDWRLLFDVDPEVPAQRAKRLDGHLPGSLIGLPHQIAGEDDGADYGSLAVRDLQRGLALGLPSGEAVARRLGVEPLSPQEAGLAQFGWDAETPLWIYILREAGARGDGERLGTVGGRIVGEVLIGLIDADPESYRAVEPDWQPTLPAAPGRSFGVTDILAPTE